MNTTCGWYITASKNHIVVLRLTYALNTDTVKVYDVDGAELSLINSFTGGGQGYRQTTTVYSKFHGLYILLDSDNKTSKKEEGIFASYAAISPGRCKARLWDVSSIRKLAGNKHVPAAQAHASGYSQQTKIFMEHAQTRCPSAVRLMFRGIWSPLENF